MKNYRCLGLIVPISIQICNVNLTPYREYFTHAFNDFEEIGYHGTLPTLTLIKLFVEKAQGINLKCNFTSQVSISTLFIF